MSEDSSQNTSLGPSLNTEDPSVSQDEGTCDVSSAPDPQQVERALKEVGSTSAAFIGPALPPGLAAAKTDVEDSLSAFYKELEEIDAQNAATNAGTNDEKQSLRSHWHHNAPYPSRKPAGEDHPDTPSAQTAWRHPPPPRNGTVKPAFQHELPPPVPRPPPPPMMFNDWGPPNTHNFPAPGFPPPNHFSHSSQGFYHEPPHHFDMPFHDYGCQREEQYWGHHDFDSEMDIWERRHHPPPPCPGVLILMRGLPGSGKSTLARELCTGPSGLILSTDDYFDNRGGYRYDVGLLGAAHKWNQDRARDAMHAGRTPIIIDNTNLQAWEMKPYVQMALDSSYRVDFCEPDTRWKFDPCELEKRNTHGVDRTKIAQMLDRFSSPVSVSVVMNSQEPQHVRRGREPEQLGRSREYDGYGDD